MSLSLNRLSLLWRILLSSSIVITALLALTGWVVQSYVLRVGEQSLEEEVRTSLQAYQTLWTARARNLASISRLISSMSDVRGAFLTHDRATIRDSGQELWHRISDNDAIFLVLDPDGGIITSLSGNLPDLSVGSLSFERIRNRFPSQVEGFLPQGQHLFYVVLTPVYVQSGSGQALINILLAGFELNQKLAEDLKRSTRGSDFAFLSEGHLNASTLAVKDAAALQSGYRARNGLQPLRLNGADYLALGASLNNVEGYPIGELLIVRSFATARRALSELQRNVGVIWVFAVLAGLAFTYLLARRIVEPVKRLDRAASEVARHNYDYRVPVESEDELGRLARTFNEMCDSLRSAREELVRQERITTIGRLSTSIVHDLRNPLAAVYGGAEMLVDSDLLPAQSKRLAANIYSASRRIQELLQDLSNISRGKAKSMELCRLADVINAACDVIAPAADSQGVRLSVSVPDDIHLQLERARMERLFLNLLNNALEAMLHGGDLRIGAERHGDDVLVSVEDTGAGISEQIRDVLFQPFVSAGKKNGLGLGLALARQTALDHGGDLWAAHKDGHGALFYLRLPGCQSPDTPDRIFVPAQEQQH